MDKKTEPELYFLLGNKILILLTSSRTSSGYKTKKDKLED
jgi:hypothetical protein